MFECDGPGDVTFSSLPTANSSVTTGTADISFDSPSGTLVVRIQYGVYASMTANATDVTSLDDSGYGAAGNTGYHIDGLNLTYGSWPIRGSVETVNLAESSLEFQKPSGTTWFNPRVSAQASVPEPPSILLGLAVSTSAAHTAKQPPDQHCLCRARWLPFPPVQGNRRPALASSVRHCRLC